MTGSVHTNRGRWISGLAAVVLLSLITGLAESRAAVSFDSGWRLGPKYDRPGGLALPTPAGVAVGPDGTVFVGMDAGGFVRRFTPDGKPDGRFDVGDYWVFDIAVAPDGDVLVQTIGGLKRFTSVGKVVKSWKPQGLTLSSSGGLDVAPDGTVYITENEGAAGVVMLDERGRFIKRFGKDPNKPKYFESVSDIAVAPDGSLLATDPEGSRVIHFSAGGKRLGSWGKRSMLPGGLIDPWELDIDDQGNVYVIDYTLARIQRFGVSGNFIEQWGAQGSDRGHFTYPDGMAVGADGSVYVADAFRRVRKFTVDDEPPVGAAAITFGTTNWNNRVRVGGTVKIGFYIHNFGTADATGVRICPPRKGFVSRLFTGGTACRKLAPLKPHSGRTVRFRLKGIAGRDRAPYIGMWVDSDSAGNGIASSQLAIRPKHR